jgi:hypothetical protein
MRPALLDAAHGGDTHVDPFFLVLGSGEGATGEVHDWEGRHEPSAHQLWHLLVQTPGMLLRPSCSSSCEFQYQRLIHHRAPSSGIAKRRSWTNFNKKQVFYFFVCVLFF